jgi:hypothetical protein
VECPTAKFSFFLYVDEILVEEWAQQNTKPLLVDARAIEFA